MHSACCSAEAELAQCQDELQKAKETEAALTAELQQSKAAAAASEEAKAELAAELRESKDAVEAAKRFKADLQPGLASLKDRILALELRLPDEPAQARASLRIRRWLGHHAASLPPCGQSAMLYVWPACTSARQVGAAVAEEAQDEGQAWSRGVQSLSPCGSGRGWAKAKRPPSRVASRCPAVGNGEGPRQVWLGRWQVT